MFITIETLKSKWASKVTAADLEKYIKGFLAKHNIAIGRTDKAGTTLTLYASVEGKVFAATADNRVILKPGDKRIKPGKEFLISRNLSTRQMTAVQTLLSRGLTDIGLEVDIKLYEDDDADVRSFIQLKTNAMDDTQKIFMLQKSFPTEVTNAEQTAKK